MRRRLHRRLVRTSTFAGSLSPSPTSSTVVSPHATRSDQPMCVIHPALATSVLIERALHRAWRAVAASPLQAAVASPRGLLRHCFLTAADHVPDLIVDSSLRASRMVFVKLYEFFAVSFEHRRRIIRIIRPCAENLVPLLASSSTTTSPASPSRPRLLRLLQQALASSTSPSSAPVTAMEAFSAGPSWRRRLIVHPPMHVRYWQHRCVPIVPDVFPSLANSGMFRPMA